MGPSFSARCLRAALVVFVCLVCSEADGTAAPQNVTVTSSCPHEERAYCEWPDEWRFDCRSTPCCVPSAWQCDGEADCSDGSDEEGCSTNTECSPEEFTCLTSHSCVPLLFKCDTEDDCLDGSDEDNCSSICKENWFPCDNGKCVLEDYTCDTENDCGDWSDEHHLCPRRVCTDAEFQCVANGACIPGGWVCDEQLDCSDGSDEVNCSVEPSPSTCGFAMFNCTSGECISAASVCNGQQECSDGSDESFCKMRCNPESEAFCPASNLCIPSTWICDGEVDCREGDDEVDCDVTTCNDNEYNCHTGKCVPETMRCDGKDDCENGLDEYFCNGSPPPLYCLAHEFQCRTDQKCINGNKLCDNVTDCVDGSDEHRCDYVKENGCEKDNGGCKQRCLNTTYSHLCSCALGYRLNLNDRRDCLDVDECAVSGMCSQFCYNSFGSYSCACAEGYTLQQGSFCKANGEPAYLLLSDQHSIQKIPISDSGSLGPATILVHNLPQTLAIDIDIRNGKLYWADIRQKAIFKSNLNGSNMEVVVDGSLQSPDGIAVDWVSQKVYWTDSTKGTIEVASMNGEDQKVLIWENLDKPRAIVVDPIRRYMYWSDWGNPAKIERASMDGQNREVLHYNMLYWPNALTLDIATERLYWADAKYHVLQSSNADGSDRRTILSGGVNHPFSLTLFESTVYWTDWRTRSIQAVHKGIQVKARQLMATIDMPMGIKAVHTVVQPMAENKCGSNNGGCSGMCLLSNASAQGYSCVCPAGSRLAVDGKDCEVTGVFVLAAAVNTVLKVAVDDEIGIFQVPLSLDGLVGVSDVTLDSKGGLMFWSDLRGKSISMANITGKNQRTLFSNDLLAPEGVAFDWLTRKLYWVDSGAQRIEVADITSGNRTVLISTGLDRPRGLAVDPYRGHIYWTDWGVSPRIERAGLDGSNREVVIDLSYGQDTHLPNGITLDLAEQRLYWVEGSTKAIFFANLNGTGRTKLPISSVGDSFMYGVAVHGDYVYWSDVVHQSIKRRHKLPNEQEDRAVIIQNSRMAFGLEVVHTNREIVPTPCDVDNGGCSHLCLLRPSPDSPGALSASCKCPTGYRLTHDNRTCSSEISAFALVADKTSIKMVSLDIEALLPIQISISGSYQFDAVDYDLVEDMIYWVDSSNSAIMRVSRKGGDPTVVVSGLGHPNGLALDWVGRNLYFTDSLRSQIGVSSLDGKHRGVLLWKDMHTPQSLVIHQESKMLYWVDWDSAGKSMQVEKSFLDGSGREVLFNSSTIVPQGLAVRGQQGGVVVCLVDASSQAVFEFHESTKVLRSFYMGQQSLSSIYLTSEYMFATAISSPGDGGILLKTSWGEFNSGAVVEDSVEHFVTPMDVRVFHRQELQNLDLHSSHPCSALSHGCSHFCLPSNASSTQSQFSCACPTGIGLKEDGKTCKEAPSEFILYGTSDSLRHVSLETADMNDIIVKNSVGPVVSVDYVYHSKQQDGNSTKNYIFWTDNLQGTLNRAFFNGSCPNNSCVLFRNLGSPEGLAYDWMTGNIYVIDALSKQIKVVSSDGSIVRTIISSQIDRPRAVAVHPGKGYLFWSDWVQNQPRIEMATLSGDARMELVSVMGQFPNGLAIDAAGEWLYWTDGKLGKIHRVRTNGTGRETVVENTGHAFGLAHYNNTLYWTEWSNNSLNSVSLNGGTYSQISKISARPFGVTVVHPNRPHYDTNPCAVNNGGCPYFCLMIDTKTWKCACPDDVGDECEDRYGHLDMPTAITFTSGTTTSVTRPNDPEEDEHTPTSNPITVNSTAPNHVTEPSETPEGSSGPTHTTEEEATPSPPSTGGIVFLDQWSVSPGIFAAYIIIAFIAILIVVIIFVVCCITLNIRRQRKTLLRMGTVPKGGSKDEEGSQNANPVVQVKSGSSKAHNKISVVVQPGSASTERTATESYSATSSPSTRMANVPMLVLDDISHTSSGMDLGSNPSFSTCSNESPLEASGETTPASISVFARCASQDSGMA